MSKPRREGTASDKYSYHTTMTAMFHEQAPARGDCKQNDIYWGGTGIREFHEQAPARGDCKFYPFLDGAFLEQSFMSKPRREGTARGQKKSKVYSTCLFHEQAPARGDCKLQGMPAPAHCAAPCHEQAPARGDCKLQGRRWSHRSSHTVS